MNKQNFVSWSIDGALRIGLIFLILMISFLIFKPFLLLIVWGIIIAVTFYPLHKKLTKLLKGKNKASATILTIVLLTLIIIPSILFLNTTIDSLTNLSDGLKSGSFNIPPPPQEVADWPVVGKPIYEFWQLSSNNLASAIEKFGDQFSQVGTWLLGSIGGLIGSIFVFIFALIISGMFLTTSDKSYIFSIDLVDKLAGKNGKRIIDNSKATIQSVVKGVVGVALIQATLLGIGFWAVGLPGASLLTLVVFIIALVQVPATIIVIPIIIYVFSVESTTIAVIFTIYSLLAGMSDNILKPLLLGRGVEIPMLIILIGSIGGMMLFGMIGLFVGSVVLALTYQLFQDWMNFNNKEETSELP